MIEQRWEYALAGGDDYELCFTISRRIMKNFCNNRTIVTISVIGKFRMLKAGLTFSPKWLRPFHCNLHGYQHFA